MRLGAVGLLLVALAAFPSFASAQSARATAMARAQFREGVTAAEADEWETAHAAFARSYELSPRPATLFNLARAQARVGRLVEATESFRRFLSEARQRRYRGLRADAEEELQAIEPRLGAVRITVRAAEPGDELQLDDAELPRAALDAQMPIDPGEHTLRVLRDGEEAASTAFTIAEGGSERVTLEVQAPELPAVTLEPATPAPMPTPAPAESGGDDGGVIALVVTLVVLALAGGGVALGFLLYDETEPPFQGNLGNVVVR